jgi:hypothetical protein
MRRNKVEVKKLIRNKGERTEKHEEEKRGNHEGDKKEQQGEKKHEVGRNRKNTKTRKRGKGALFINNTYIFKEHNCQTFKSFKSCC